jgi:hypothetical protein
MTNNLCDDHDFAMLYKKLQSARIDAMMRVDRQAVTSIDCRSRTEPFSHASCWRFAVSGSGLFWLRRVCPRPVTC